MKRKNRPQKEEKKKKKTKITNTKKTKSEQEKIDSKILQYYKEKDLKNEYNINQIKKELFRKNLMKEKMIGSRVNNYKTDVIFKFESKSKQIPKDCIPCFQLLKNEFDINNYIKKNEKKLEKFIIVDSFALKLKENISKIEIQNDKKEEIQKYLEKFDKLDFSNGDKCKFCEKKMCTKSYYKEHLNNKIFGWKVSDSITNVFSSYASAKRHYERCVIGIKIKKAKTKRNGECEFCKTKLESIKCLSCSECKKRKEKISKVRIKSFFQKRMISIKNKCYFRGEKLISTIGLREHFKEYKNCDKNTNFSDYLGNIFKFKHGHMNHIISKFYMIKNGLDLQNFYLNFEIVSRETNYFMSTLRIDDIDSLITLRRKDVLNYEEKKKFLEILKKYHDRPVSKIYSDKTLLNQKYQQCLNSDAINKVNKEEKEKIQKIFKDDLMKIFFIKFYEFKLDNFKNNKWNNNNNKRKNGLLYNEIYDLNLGETFKTDYFFKNEITLENIIFYQFDHVKEENKIVFTNFLFNERKNNYTLDDYIRNENSFLRNFNFLKKRENFILNCDRKEFDTKVKNFIFLKRKKIRSKIKDFDKYQKLKINFK
jgi:hypothetical protein